MPHELNQNISISLISEEKGFNPKTANLASKNSLRLELGQKIKHFQIFDLPIKSSTLKGLLRYGGMSEPSVFERKFFEKFDLQKNSLILS